MKVIFWLTLCLLIKIPTSSAIDDFAMFGESLPVVIPKISFQRVNLTWTQRKVKSLYGHLFKRELTDLAAKTLVENPIDSLVLAYSYVKAEYMTRKYCSLGLLSKRQMDDEVDALRHFLGAFYFASSIDPDEAEMILSSHEVKRSYLSHSNKMDVFNNSIGVSTAKDIASYPDLFPDRVEDLMDKYLNEGWLRVIFTKKSGCQRNNLYPNYVRWF